MASWRTVLTLIGAVTLAGCTTTQSGTVRGAVVPTTTVRALDSSETQLASALNGRPALVALWATWCDACRDEMPALNRLDAWARDRGAVVVGVAIGEPLSRVSSFAAEHHLPYLVLVDEDFHLADALGAKNVPSTLVIDRTGRIVYAGGAVDERSFSVFRSLLANDGPVAATTPAGL